MSEADKLLKVEKHEVEKEHAKAQAQADADKQKAQAQADADKQKAKAHADAEKQKAEAANEKAKKDAKNEAEKIEKEKQHQKAKVKDHHDKDVAAVKAHEKKPYEPPKRYFDMNRDTTIRYFGYGHEVGNCARGVFGCATRYLTLLPAWGAFTMAYIVRDAYDRSRRSYVHCPQEVHYQPSYLRSFFEWLGIVKKPVKPPVPSEETQRTKACIACGDALLWQGLASLLIPALLMRNTQYYGRRVLCSMGANKTVIRFVPTLAALSLLPLLGQPIDHFVDNVFDNTYRYWFSDY